MSHKGGKISLLVGVLTGTLTGLLFAPTKGKQLREKIAQERKSGGVGYKAVGNELSHMADDISSLVKKVAQSQEARAFWQKTNEKVQELSEGTVNLDQWVKEAHQRADQFKKVVSKYAMERKKELRGEMGQAQKVTRKAVKKVKKVTRRLGQKVDLAALEMGIVTPKPKVPKKKAGGVKKPKTVLKKANLSKKKTVTSKATPKKASTSKKK